MRFYLSPRFLFASVTISVKDPDLSVATLRLIEGRRAEATLSHPLAGQRLTLQFVEEQV